MKMASSSALLKNIHRYQKRGTELRICGSQLLSAVLLKTSRTLRRNATTSNFCPKLSCAAFPIRSASPDTRASLLIAHAKLSGVFSHRKPVTPCITVSLGPPLLHATTGLWYCMASSGTIPKCSSFGVYKTHKL